MVGKAFLIEENVELAELFALWEQFLDFETDFLQDEEAMLDLRQFCSDPRL